jgi:hypothetical protein
VVGCDDPTTSHLRKAQNRLNNENHLQMLLLVTFLNVAKPKEYNKGKITRTSTPYH